MKFNNFDELMELVKGKTNSIVIPGANNAEVMQACKMGVDSKIISGGVLIGPKSQIEEVTKKVGLDTSIFEIIDISDTAEMCNLAVDFIRDGKGDFLVRHGRRR